MSIAQLSVVFFLQMFVILATCRAVGWLGQRYLKQPQVVGEMIAGVPMFFTYSGLNTQLTMVNNASMLLVALAVLGASVLAKFGACWPPRDSRDRTTAPHSVSAP